MINDSKKTQSNTRVLRHGIDARLRGERVPVGAGLVQRVVVDHAPELVHALDDLQREPFLGVPADVAVHQPRARVVGLEGEHEVAVGGQQGDVAAGRVGEVEGGQGGGGVESSGAGSEDVEVVAYI